MRTTNKRWDEKRIKAILIDVLLQEHHDNKIICSEMPFLGGKRWADIVMIKDNLLTVYEIKSELDSLAKIQEQLNDYKYTFNEVYVVLARKFWKQDHLLPKDVGCFLFKEDEEKLILKRRSKKRLRLHKDNLSLFLWKEDIPFNFKKNNEEVMIARKRIVKESTTQYLHALTIKTLLKRYRNRFDYFMREKSDKTHYSEISVLTKKETNIG